MERELDAGYATSLRVRPLTYRKHICGAEPEPVRSVIVYYHCAPRWHVRGYYDWRI